MARSLLLLAVMACVAIGVARGDESIVTIAQGTLQGNVNEVYNAREFLGIPFGAPPIGALRWADPEPAAAWTGTFDATQFGNGCIQKCNLPPHTCPEVTSEDCLNLNVYTPRLAAINQPLPVLLFFPGGRFEQGTAGVWFYQGDVIANMTNTIVVTTNYRLGIFGFMAATNLAGSYGIKDQRLAMKWVQANIAAFGGDPNRVTIFGQSAGGSSVSVHLTTPGSKGLFHQAISHSAPFTLYMKTAAEAGALTAKVAGIVGCGGTDIDCLRAQSPEALLSAAISVENAFNFSNIIETFYPWTPIVDGVDLVDQPIVLLNTSRFNAVPLMIGNVEEEGLMFIWEADSTNLTDVEYVAFLALVFKEDYSEVHSIYPANHYIWEDGDNRWVLANLSTDYLFNCPSRMVARAFEAAGQPVYSYHFNHALSFDGWGQNYSECIGHACHGVELPYLFQSPPRMGFPLTADEQVMADSMSLAWGQFAWGANPNVPVALEQPWPAYDAVSDTIIEFMTPADGTTTGYKQVQCDMWDTVGYVPKNIPSTLKRAVLKRAPKRH